MGGIDRQGTDLVNPSPDDEVLPGDQVLLLGRADDLERARRALTGSA